MGIITTIHASLHTITQLSWKETHQHRKEVTRKTYTEKKYK